MPRKIKNNDSSLEKVIAQYITVDGEDLSNIRVDLDSLAMHLLKKENRYFSVSKFERMLKQEMESKLLGRPFTETSMRKLCSYINELSKYLTEDFSNAERNRIEEISKRHREK